MVCMGEVLCVEENLTAHHPEHTVPRVLLVMCSGGSIILQVPSVGKGELVGFDWKMD